MTAEIKTPVTIIGGYLGAGKTTLINHLLRHANGRRLAILVNEFGDLAIDADLIEAEGDDIISLAGGCVCCSYGNDLIMAMMEMAQMNPRPDHIVLEASGVALPGAIANSVSLLDAYSVDGLIVLADAETVQQRARDKYMSDTILRQLADANIVLLNKTDLISTARRDDVLQWLTDVAKNASVLEAEYSSVPSAVILSQFENANPDQSDFYIHDVAAFRTESIMPPQSTDPDAYAKELIGQRAGLVRAKGFVRSKDGSLKTLQIVGKRYEITSAPHGVEPGIVVIESTQ